MFYDLENKKVENLGENWVASNSREIFTDETALIRYKRKGG